MWHLELQIKYRNNRGCKSPKWSDASIGTGPGWKPDMSCKSTLCWCTNINKVNICKVFVLTNTMQVPLVPLYTCLLARNGSPKPINKVRCLAGVLNIKYAVCPVGRGCCLENSLDVKVSGVRIPNTAFKSPSSSGLGHLLLKQETTVQICLEILL